MLENVHICLFPIRVDEEDGEEERGLGSMATPLRQERWTIG